MLKQKYLLELSDRVDKDFIEQALKAVGYNNKAVSILETNYRESKDQWECFVWDDDDIAIWVQNPTLKQCYKEIWMSLINKKPDSLYKFAFSFKGEE